MSTVKKAVVRQGFKTGEFVVYPSHGVGQITAIEEQEVAGFKLELFVVSFAKDKMTLRVPTAKAASVGLRKLADAESVTKALTTLTGRARVKRTMWSRRAQEYEAKINSGDLVAIAEVVRDLYRSEAQPEQSYSERQLYEAAVDRMTRESPRPRPSRRSRASSPSRPAVRPRARWWKPLRAKSRATMTTCRKKPPDPGSPVRDEEPGGRPPGFFMSTRASR